MTSPRGILLASFLNEFSEEQVTKEVEFIVNKLELSNNYIFLLHNTEDPSKQVLTYNLSPGPRGSYHPHLYTIRVHRKKLTNTLYTINALNLAVASQYSGSVGKHLKLDWEPYRNTLLLTQGKKLVTHPLEVIKIFEIEDPPEEN